MEHFSQIPIKPPGAFRVVHSADWHLGKMLGELSREEEHRRFLDWMVEVIREGEVDVLVIAGDVFDSAYPPQSALRLYYSFLSEVYRTTSCSVVVVAGNHDSPAQLEAPKGVLEALRVRVVGAIPDDPRNTLVVLPDEDQARLVVAAVPFLRDRDLRTGEVGQTSGEISKALVKGIAKRYEEVAEAAAPWIDSGVPVMATGHLTVAHSKRSDSEREIHIGGLGSVGADIFPEVFGYVALGHLHRPQAAGGKEKVRYAGSPIPLSFGEATDKKEVRVLDFDGGKMVGCALVLVPVWRRLVQVRAERAELELRISECGKLMEGQGDIGDEGRLGEGKLTTWVEVVVNNPVGGENLMELVREMAEGRDFEVVRVVAAGVNSAVGAKLDEGEGRESGDDILSDPERVFEMRLEGEEGLTEEERGELALAFRELVDVYGERQRGEEDAHR